MGSSPDATAAPVVVVEPAPLVEPAPSEGPAVQSALASPTEAQLSVALSPGAPAQPVGSAAAYQPMPATAGSGPQAIGRRLRRGDHLSDPANTGEIVDLMISSGAYGLFLANSIVTWSGFDDSASEDDQVRVRFVTSLLGAAVSLTGLLASDTPRGVPTTMSIGLRYGALLGGLTAGALGGDVSNVDGALAAIALGGIIGLGAGTGIGYGLRPHISRSRFVESAVPWGLTFGGMLAGAFHGNSQEVFGGLLAGTLGAMIAHSIVAAVEPVNVGRGWLLDAAFGVGAGAAALFTWGFGGATASDATYFATMSATGFVALAIVFALSGDIQDSGWASDLDEALSSVQVGVAPTAGGGAVATVHAEF